MDRRRWLNVSVLLGVTLLAAAGLTRLWSLQAQGPGEDAQVRVTVTGPDDGTMLNRSVAVPAAENTVLRALLEAAQHEGVPVRLQDYAYGVMVVAIGGIENEGACGWVYEVGDVSGPYSAAEYRVRDGDHVRWSWACHRP